MKNKFFIIFCILGIASYSQYTEVPDINFETYLENMGYGDGIQGNGLVLTDEIDDIIELDVTMMNISSLTGIEDFAALEILGCPYNFITHLDVSQNQHLKTLVCHINQITSLTLNNPELEILSCFENLLTEVDTSQSPLLNYLDIGYNIHLQNLDVTQNPLITYLSCGGNLLTSLNLQYNTQLEMLSCEHNLINSIDLSNSPNLITFSCGDNPPLEFLDMRNGNNEGISTFNSEGTDDLQCIFVDDASANYLDEWFKDDFTHFVNNEQECDDLGVKDRFNQKLIFYPNPVKTKLTVENPDLKIMSIKVNDSSGRMVIQQTISEKQAEIDFSHLPSGIYFVSFEENGKVWKTEKVIKQ